MSHLKEITYGINNFAAIAFDFQFFSIFQYGH